MPQTARRLGDLVPGVRASWCQTSSITFWDGDGALIALQEYLERHRFVTELTLANVELPNFELCTDRFENIGDEGNLRRAEVFTGR